LAALALPAAAQADPDAVVRDCAADGTVDGNYSDADRREALKRIPSDLDAYSDCRAQIGGGLGGPKAGASGNGGGGAGAGAAGATATATARAAKRRKAARAAARRKKARRATEAALGDRKADPRNNDVFEASDTSNGLPTPVLLALIALGLFGAAAGVMALSKRNEGLAAMLRRVPVPFSRR
jgi:hypothetical protein